MKTKKSEEPASYGFRLTKPCDECPFRVNAKLHEGVIKATVEMFNAIDERRFAFSCHKTDPRSDAKGQLVDGKPQHCGGALVLQRNMGVIRKNTYLWRESFLGNFSFRRIRKSTEVFRGPAHMLRHYLSLYKAAKPEKAHLFDGVDLA